MKMEDGDDDGDGEDDNDEKADDDGGEDGEDDDDDGDSQGWLAIKAKRFEIEIRLSPTGARWVTQWLIVLLNAN